MPMVYPKHVPLIDPNCANRPEYVNHVKFQCYESAAMKHVTIYFYNSIQTFTWFFVSSLLHAKHKAATMMKIETMPSYGGYFNA